MADDTVEAPPVLRIVPYDTFDVDGVHYEEGVAADVPRLIAERLLLAGKAIAASAEAHDAFGELAEAAHGQVVPLVEEHDLPSKKQAVALGKDADSAPPAEKPLDDLTVAELKALAADRNVDLAGASKKAELVAALQAAEAAPPAPPADAKPDDGG